MSFMFSERHQWYGGAIEDLFTQWENPTWPPHLSRDIDQLLCQEQFESFPASYSKTRPEYQQCISWSLLRSIIWINGDLLGFKNLKCCIYLLQNSMGWECLIISLLSSNNWNFPPVAATLNTILIFSNCPIVRAAQCPSHLCVILCFL